MGATNIRMLAKALNTPTPTSPRWQRDSAVLSGWDWAGLSKVGFMAALCHTWGEIPGGAGAGPRPEAQGALLTAREPFAYYGDLDAPLKASAFNNMERRHRNRARQ